MSKAPHFEEIHKVANHFNLEPLLLAAITIVESSNIPQAIRYERGYEWLFKPEHYARELKITKDTERKLQQFSFGLMQIIGATAREQGFSGYLTDLCKPEVGLYWGAKYLAMLLKKHGDRDKAIVSYNAGAPRWDEAVGKWENQEYLDKVLTHYEDLKHAYSNTTDCNT